MAYITANQTRDIKQRLKNAFPGFKFSVVNRHHTSVDVVVLNGPIDFSDMPDAGDARPFDPTYFSVNQYHLYNYRKYEGLFRRMFEIINDGNFDKSDIMTDYFNVGWYAHLSVGVWDKPYVVRKSSTPRKPIAGKRRRSRVTA